MDINRNIFPIAFEPVEELIDAAYISDDFTLAMRTMQQGLPRRSQGLWVLQP